MSLSESILISNFLDESVIYLVSKDPMIAGEIAEGGIATIRGIVIGDVVTIIANSGKIAVFTVNSTSTSKYLARYNLVYHMQQLSTKERINQRSNGELAVVVDGMIDREYADIPMPSKIKSKIDKIIARIYPEEIKQGYTPSDTSTSKGELIAVSGIVLVFIVILIAVLFYLYYSRSNKIITISDVGGTIVEPDELSILI